LAGFVVAAAGFNVGPLKLGKVDANRDSDARFCNT